MKNSDSSLQNKVDPYRTVNKVQETIFISPITEQEVALYIKLLNPQKSTRSDSSPTKFIKISSKVITPVITKIINKCIESAVFPVNLKIGEIIPIFKKGDKLQVTNHRPITLLSPFSKIYERHIHNQITNFINKHKILHPFQYGFRKNSSTEQAITQITEEIANNMQDKYHTCSIFLDLAKAFDTIDHKILLAKLHLYGIRGHAGQLLSSYLSQRTQRTKINNVHSNYCNVTCGIPQGSILGPLVFDLFINDIPQASNFSVRLFADDACLTLRDKDPKVLEIKANQELQKIDDWVKINRLTINYSKSYCILFNRQNITRKIKIKMSGKTIEQVKTIKYLGVHIDQGLNWKQQIQKIQAKLTSASYIIIKTRHYLTIPTLKMLYYSLIFPQINYCLTAWGGANKSTLQPIINQQKKLFA